MEGSRRISWHVFGWSFHPDENLTLNFHISRLDFRGAGQPRKHTHRGTAALRIPDTRRGSPACSLPAHVRRVLECVRTVHRIATSLRGILLYCHSSAAGIVQCLLFVLPVYRTCTVTSVFNTLWLMLLINFLILQVFGALSTDSTKSSCKFSACS